MTAATGFEQYAADGALVTGGGAAILLQLADPVVGRAVAAHSAFAEDPMRRLRHTLSYVYAVGLGSPEQSALVAGFVDRAHHGIPGAVDPEHQLWVAATLYAVGRDVHERLFAPLSAELDADVLAGSARLGTSLQLPAAAWPADRAAFDRYWTDAVAGLQVTDDARAVARDLLHPRRVPPWVRIMMPLARTVTPTLLPDPVASAYGFTPRPRRERLAWAWLRLLVRLAPRRIRSLPSRRLLARLGSAPRG